MIWKPKCSPPIDLQAIDLSKISAITRERYDGNVHYDIYVDGGIVSLMDHEYERSGLFEAWKSFNKPLTIGPVERVLKSESGSKDA